MIVAALFTLLLTASPLPAASDATPGMTYHFERPGSPQPEFTIVIGEDGTGSYQEGKPDAEGAKRPVSITASAQTVAKILAAKATVQSGQCESHLKNIANTGKKHLTFTHDGQTAACDFNYSDDEKLNSAVDALQAIARTIQTGDKLAHDHRFDHLGLDADLDGLLEAAKSGYAIEFQNIARALQSIVNDDEMMSPSRRKAKQLLDLASLQSPASAR